MSDSTPRTMPIPPGIHLALGILQVVIGLSALAGGVGLVSDPGGGTLGLRVESLTGSPFSDFLIPGIVLLAGNGIASLAGSVASFRRHRLAGKVAMALGVLLMVWIFVQVWIIGLSHWLQPLYFLLGLAEVFMGSVVLGARRPEPGHAEG